MTVKILSNAVSNVGCTQPAIGGLQPIGLYHVSIIMRMSRVYVVETSLKIMKEYNISRTVVTE